MKDPFSPDPKPVRIGAVCILCSKKVCASPKCGAFYTKQFCMPCVQANIDLFPIELQREAKKHIKTEDK